MLIDTTNRRGQPVPIDDQQVFDCPSCGIPTLHIIVEAAKKIPPYRELTRVIVTQTNEGPLRSFNENTLKHFIYECVKCKKHTYFLLQTHCTIHAAKGESKRYELFDQIPTVIIRHQFPVSTPTTHPALDTHEDIKKALYEAELDFAVGTFNSCGVMARRAIDAICQDKKAKGSRLKDKIDYLKENHIITPDIADWVNDLMI